MTDADLQKAKELTTTNDAVLLERLMSSRDQVVSLVQQYSEIRDKSSALENEINVIEAALRMKYPNGWNLTYRGTLIRIPDQKHGYVKYEGFESVS